METKVSAPEGERERLVTATASQWRRVKTREIHSKAVTMNKLYGAYCINLDVHDVLLSKFCVCSSFCPGSFPFAKCFICGEKGHITKQCPDNPRGLYPKGRFSDI